ncbi:outer membrane lipoprotein-sorting protein, partial [Planctomycetota bacterium]
TYLQDLRRVKRVATSQVTESFAGTGFAFEDLRAEDLHAHRYRTVGRKQIQGRDAYLIEARPIRGRVRALKGYSKRIIYVDAVHWVEMQIDFYDHQGRHAKTQHHTKWQSVANIWRPYRVKMVEHLRHRTTWLRFRSWEANVKLDDELFTTRELIREHR